MKGERGFLESVCRRNLQSARITTVGMGDGLHKKYSEILDTDIKVGTDVNQQPVVARC